MDKGDKKNEDHVTDTALTEMERKTSISTFNGRRHVNLSDNEKYDSSERETDDSVKIPIRHLSSKSSKVMKKTTESSETPIRSRSGSSERTTSSIRKQNCHDSHCSYCFPQGASRRLHGHQFFHRAGASSPIPCGQDQGSSYSRIRHTITSNSRKKVHRPAPVSVSPRDQMLEREKTKINRSTSLRDSYRFVSRETKRILTPTPGTLYPSLRNAHSRGSDTPEDSEAVTSLSKNPSSPQAMAAVADHFTSISSRSTPHSELFTQMEPLFPQYAELHEGPKPLKAVVDEVKSSGPGKNNGHSLEVHFSKPETIIKCETRPPGWGRRIVTAPTIEVTFAQPVHTSSNVTPGGTSGANGEEHMNGLQAAGIENVQLMKAEGQPNLPYVSPPEKRDVVRSEPSAESRLSPSGIRHTGRPPTVGSGRPDDALHSVREQAQETDLSVKTTTSASNQPGRSGYSAHRERLRQERERELLMRQQQKRQLAASSTGLNEQLHQQNRQQQQYRSLSAVNTPSVSEAVEEIETVVLQFIGRGVQDVDSRVGSMTTLPRGRGGSMTDGLQNVDSSQRGGLAKRGYSSTQFLARNNSNSDLVKPMPMHQSQTMISPSPQPLQASRFNTSATLVNHSQATVLLNGSRGHLSPTNSTAAPTTTTPVITNGWKVDGSVKQPFIDRGQDNGNLGIVQDTAPSWYRPKLSREAAINILRQQPPGNFLIRDSTTFKGAYGLAVKVATLPPKVTQKSDDLQSELVRHYLIEVVNTPTRGVRLKGFASEPVFPSLAALIHQHTIDPLALPCRLILPPVPTNLPSSGSATLPPLVIGTVKHASAVEDGAMPDNVTVASSGSVRGAPSSEVGSLHTDGPVGPPHRMDGIAQMPIQVHDNPVPSHNVPYVCVVREGSSPQRRSPLDITGNQGLTFRCLMLGSVDTPQWSSELCFARAVDQLIPLTLLTASECDHGVSRVRYTEVQLHVSAHDGITIIDLQRRLFLRRHLPNHVLLYCGLESRKKEFSHPEHQIQGLIHPRIFGIVVRKGISECTTHVFSELDRAHTADYVVQHIRATYPHMNVR